MALFTPRANLFARMAIALVILIVISTCFIAYGWERSSYTTNQGIAVNQPVPFSHAHHVGGLGIDCRYCHTSVEKSGFAGYPPTSTCMNCHQQIWTEASVLQPVRDSWQQDKPIRWQRVNRLPDFVYFNHSIHVNKGVGCTECHGQVDQMPLMYAHAPLTMEWCLDCHRNPGPRLRPAEDIFSVKYRPPDDKEARAEQQKSLMERYRIHPIGLTNCSVCHR